MWTFRWVPTFRRNILHFIAEYGGSILVSNLATSPHGDIICKITVDIRNVIKIFVLKRNITILYNSLGRSDASMLRTNFSDISSVLHHQGRCEPDKILQH
jgi:hypothetical protein